MADILGKGEWLRENESLTSPNGRFSLIMQDDANLVLYEMSGGVPVKALWSSGTNQEFETDCLLELQDDGNFMIQADVPDEEGHRGGMGTIWSAL